MDGETRRGSGQLPIGLPEVTLADGTLVRLRPVTPADKPQAQEAFRRLSAESRFRRFFTPLEVLDGKLLDRLTTADGVDHVVWAALDGEGLDDSGLGAASFWRSREDPEAAEFSVTVGDDYQGQGIGTLLVATLWVLARELGIRRFELVALADNAPVIRWMESLGAAPGPDGVINRLTMDLSDPEKSIPPGNAGDELLRWLNELPPLLFPEAA